jgi:hypothetical protein
MGKAPRIYNYRSKSMPTAKLWPLIEKITKNYPVVRDRSAEHQNHSELTISPPASLFPEEDIALHCLHELWGELPKAWLKGKDLSQFTTQLFSAFPSATEARVTTTCSLKGVADEVLVHIYQAKGKIWLHLVHDTLEVPPGPKTNIVLRRLLELSGLPVTLKDTPTGYTIASSLSGPVIPTKSTITGEDDFIQLDCYFDAKQLPVCLEAFAKVLKGTGLSVKEMSYYVGYDNPKSGVNTLTGTHAVNDALRRFNAITPSPRTVTIGLSWGLKHYQDYQKLEKLFELVDDETNGAALLEFTYRKKPAYLDMAASIGGKGFVQLGFTENYSEAELEKEFGLKVEAQ